MPGVAAAVATRAVLGTCIVSLLPDNDAVITHETLTGLAAQPDKDQKGTSVTEGRVNVSSELAISQRGPALAGVLAHGCPPLDYRNLRSYQNTWRW